MGPDLLESPMNPVLLDLFFDIPNRRKEVININIINKNLFEFISNFPDHINTLYIIILKFIFFHLEIYLLIPLICLL